MSLRNCRTSSRRLLPAGRDASGRKRIREGSDSNDGPRRTKSRLDREERSLTHTSPAAPKDPLRLLSIVIPAQNEEGCIASTIENLYAAMRLHNIEHDIVVVDDGSTDSTWPILSNACARIPTLRPVQNTGETGFGRAVTLGLDHIR